MVELVDRTGFEPAGDNLTRVSCNQCPARIRKPLGYQPGGFLSVSSLRSYT